VAVFNVRGNTYGWSLPLNYAFGIVYIRFVGTPLDYTTQVDAGKRCERQRRLADECSSIKTEADYELALAAIEKAVRRAAKHVRW